MGEEISKDTSEAKTEVITSNSHQTLLWLGGAALLVGALLPWAEMVAPLVGSLVINGYEGDGIFSGIIGFVLLLKGLSSKGKVGKTYSGLGVILAIFAGFIVLAKFITMGAAVSDVELGFASLGPGLYLSAAGVILAFIGAARTVK